MTKKYRIGIDLGGTKTEGLLLDEHGKELARLRQPTPNQNYPELLDSIVSLVEKLEADLPQPAVIGIGAPGSASPVSGLLRNANTTILNAKPFRKELSEKLGREVQLCNDANCFALSEATDGVGADGHVVFGVILGTGVGGGLVIGQQLIIGANAVAGEWGHNPLPWATEDEFPGNECYCGQKGCIETWLSGPGLAADHYRRSNQRLTAEGLVKAAESGDQMAETSLKIYESRLARGLAQVINLLDPDVIVLGGGLSKVQRLYANIPKLWHHYVFADQVNTRLLPPKYGDASGVRGAAWLAASASTQ